MAKRRGGGARAKTAPPSAAAVRPLDVPTTRFALVCGVTVLALALRLYRLGHDPLWFDEAYTANTAQKPLGDILTLLQTEVSAPLYYVLLHGWERLAGDSEFGLRLLSALTGVAVVPALYGVGAALFSPAAGLVAATLGAFGPLHVHYSQELRMYGLVPLAALGVLYGLARLVRTPDLVGAAVLAVAVTVGLYLHYFILFLLPLAGAALLSPTRSRALAYTAGALAIAGLAFLPWISTLLGQAGPNHATDWIAGWWLHRSLWLALPWSLTVLGPGARFPPGWFKLASSTPAAVVSFGFAAAVLGMGATRAVSSRDARERATWLLTCAAVVVPLGVALVVSIVRSPIYVVGRYDVIAWAPLMVLTGAVLASLRAWIALPALALWLGVAAMTLAPHYTTDRPILVPANAGPRLADALAARAAAGDVVVFAASTRPTTEHYLGARARGLRMVSYPLGTDDHLGWIDVRIATDETFAANEAQRFASWITALRPAPERIWLVAPYSSGNRPLVLAIAALGYALDASRSDQHVMRFAKPAG